MQCTHGNKYANSVSRHGIDSFPGRVSFFSSPSPSIALSTPSIVACLKVSFMCCVRPSGIRRKGRSLIVCCAPRRLFMFCRLWFPVDKAMLRVRYNWSQSRDDEIINRSANKYEQDNGKYDEWGRKVRVRDTLKEYKDYNEALFMTVGCSADFIDWYGSGVETLAPLQRTF